MKRSAGNAERPDQIIGGLLWYGTWLATGLIAAGIILTAVIPASLGLPVNGHDIVKAGVALFILLPVVRVALMLAMFLHERDYVYAIIAALVLVIIAAGVFMEI